MIENVEQYDLTHEFSRACHFARRCLHPAARASGNRERAAGYDFKKNNTPSRTDMDLRRSTNALRWKLMDARAMARRNAASWEVVALGNAAALAHVEHLKTRGYGQIKRCATGSIPGAVPEKPMDRSLPSQRPACYALVGLLTSEFGPSGLLVEMPVFEAGIMSLTMARRLDGPFLLTKHSVTAAGPSRNHTGFPVRRPSHRRGRPPTPNSNLWDCILGRWVCQGVATKKMA